MTRHLDREIENLKKRLLGVAALTEEAGQLAMDALITRDVELAQRVIDNDNRIDEAEVEVEEECLKILALYQPVAVDLRFVVAMLKINNDLERIGDLAANIAKRAVYLASHSKVDLPVEFSDMSRLVHRMVRDSLDGFVTLDSALARRVCESDEQVDEFNRRVYDYIKDALTGGADRVMQLVQILTVSRYLERIADQATNIAEDVIYLVDGEIVRHREKTTNPLAG